MNPKHHAGKSKIFDVCTESSQTEIPLQQKKTSKYMTRYEHAKILGRRAVAINKGACVMVALQDKDTDSYFIAKRELEVI